MPRVDSVGKYTDPVSLVGEIKLEEGTFIQITRNDAHNSLIITDTRPAVQGVFTQLFSDTGPGHDAPLASPILSSWGV